MIDEYVDKGKVTAGVGWAIVAAFMVAGWAMILFTPNWRVGGMFAATGCVCSAFAATLHVRCYFVRLAGLVRATSGLAPGLDRPRPVRDL